MKRRAWVALLTVLTGVLSCAPALAVISVTGTEPPAGVPLSAPPSEIRMRFDKPIEPRMTTITVIDARGRALSGVAQVAEGDREIVLRPIALPNGTDRFLVKYDVMGEGTRDRGEGLLEFLLAAPVSGAPAGAGVGGDVPGRSVGWGIAGMAVLVLGGLSVWAVLRVARRRA